MEQVHGCAYSVTPVAGWDNESMDTMLMEPVTFSESGGIRYLHFGTELIQGAMRLRDPMKSTWNTTSK
jgi:spermidine synthase